MAEAIITQHGTAEQAALLKLVSPINKDYAEKHGFTYVVDTGTRCPDRDRHWEKLAYLRQFLPTVADDAFVVWEDADTFAVEEDDFHQALSPTSILGMVRLRHGLGGKELHPYWWNTGVMVMRNCAAVRDLFDRAWERSEEPTEEDAIVAELKDSDNLVAPTLTEAVCIPLHPKWNCWKNNEALCPRPVVRAWHGYKLDDKLSLVKAFLKTWKK